MSKHYTNENVFVNVCIYQLNCDSISSLPKTKIIPPIPVINLFYGPNVAYSHLIARPVSHTGPIVECTTRGEAKVALHVTCTDSRIAFTQDLFDASGSSEPLPRRVLRSYERTANGLEISFHVRVPKNGNYALALYSNLDNIGTGSFVPFCYYLVSSKVQTDAIDDFPAVPNDIIGPIYPSFEELFLNFKSGVPSKMSEWKNGMVKTDEVGEAILILGHKRPLTVLTEFHCSVETASLNSFSCVASTGLMTCIIVRIPSKEYANVPFLLKIYASGILHSQQIPSVYVAIILPHGNTSHMEPANQFLQSPSRCWGPAGSNYEKCQITDVTFLHSTSHMKSKCPSQDFVASDPVRSYKGGEDFECTLHHDAPLQLKSRLQQVAPRSQEQQFDQHVCHYKADAKSSSIKIRIPNAGSFVLSIYGSLVEELSGQLAPVLHCAILATKPSSTVTPFPTSFGLWSSSARHLFSPLYPTIPRNKETIVSVFLAKFRKSMRKSDREWEVVSYPEVLFVADGTTPVRAKTSANNHFEWRYVPGPADKVVGVLIKPEEESQSMAYALQFQIE